jgi:maltodextrin utilization protein YvdJ
MKKVPFAHIVRAGIFRFQDAFDVFHASFFKMFAYFVVINLMMLLPVSITIMNMSDFDYERFGMNFTTTEIPDWIPDEIPTSCYVNFNELDCQTDIIYEFPLENRGNEYTILFNVPNDQEVTEDNTIVFYHNWIDLKVRGNVIRLTYSGFNGTNFEDFHDMTPEAAATVLFEQFFQSVKPVIVLPLMIVAIGALFIMNLILITLLAAISMLFKINQNNFPSYKNMIKLFMLASTIPAILNVLLGFLGLSAFTSLSYNFITPVIALFMYRASQRKRTIVLEQL